MFQKSPDSLNDRLLNLREAPYEHRIVYHRLVQRNLDRFIACCEFCQNQKVDELTKLLYTDAAAQPPVHDSTDLGPEDAVLATDDSSTDSGPEDAPAEAHLFFICRSCLQQGFVGRLPPFSLLPIPLEPLI